MSKVYQKIAFTVYTIDKGNPELVEYYMNILDDILNTTPHGSGIDSDITLNSKSTEKCLIFDISFHYMNVNGFYVGWYDFELKVTPSLIRGIDLKITGEEPTYELKDYLYELMFDWLNSEYEENNHG
jgi:hypothetical protein